jgi:hypothetical protein
MNDPWSSFWPDLLKNVISLVIGGLVFTVAWGAVSSRRDLLSKQVASLTTWWDDWSGAAMRWFQHLRVVVRHESSVLDAGAKLEVARRLDELGEAAFTSMMKVQSAMNAVVLFDSKAIQERVEALLRAGANAQESLAAVDPFGEGAEQQLAAAEARLREFLPLGSDLVTQMTRETGFMSILRHYNRKLHERPPE